MLSLGLAVLLPLSLAVVVLLVGKASKNAAAVITILGLSVSFVASVIIVGTVLDQCAVKAPLIFFDLYATPLSVLFGLLIAYICLAASFASYSLPGAKGGYFAALLVFSGSMLGMVHSATLPLLFFFFKLSTVVSIYLVAYEKKQAFEAAFKYYALSAVASAFVIGGMVLMGTAVNSLEIATILNYSGPVELPLKMAIVFLMVGFGTKAAILPLHAWLPDAHAEAPSPVSAVLSGAMIKTGVYAMIVLVLPFTDKVEVLPSVFIVAGLFTMVAGALLAISQPDIKRLLAYSSISQMGFIIIALGFNNSLAFAAALFYILAHGITKALLFISAGTLVHKLKLRNLEDLGGLYQKVPITTICFSVGALSLAGLPAFILFPAKLFVFYAGILTGTALSITAVGIAVATAILTAAYAVRVAQKSFFGEQSPKALKLGDVAEPRGFVVAMLILSASCIVIGCYPHIVAPMLEAAIEWVKL